MQLYENSIVVCGRLLGKWRVAHFTVIHIYIESFPVDSLI